MTLAAPLPRAPLQFADLLTVLAFPLLSTIVNCQALPSVKTERTTLTATASSACMSCVRTCIVYGVEGSGNYTAAGTAIGDNVTITEPASGSPKNISGACDSFMGACVVDVTAAGGAPYTTTAHETIRSAMSTGNNKRFNGLAGSSDGYIGQAAGLDMGILAPAVALALVTLGFFLWL